MGIFSMSRKSGFTTSDTTQHNQDNFEDQEEDNLSNNNQQFEAGYKNTIIAETENQVVTELVQQQ